MMTDSPNPHKQELRSEVSAQVAQFLASGGKIQEVKMGLQAEETRAFSIVSEKKRRDRMKKSVEDDLK